MKLERSMSVDDAEAVVRERTATYFALAGYRQAIDQPHLMSFQRGAFPHWTPDKWNVNAVVRTQPASDQATAADILLAIDTSGQFVIKSERWFWQNEMDDLERFMRTGKMDAEARAKEKRPMLRRSLVASAVVLGVVILAMIGVFFALRMLWR